MAVDLFEVVDHVVLITGGDMAMKTMEGDMAMRTMGGAMDMRTMVVDMAMRTKGGDMDMHLEVVDMACQVVPHSQRSGLFFFIWCNSSVEFKMCVEFAHQIRDTCCGVTFCTLIVL